MVRATLPNEDAQDLGGIRVDVPPEESLIRFAPPGECGSTSGVSRRPCIVSQPRTRSLTVPFRTNNTPTTTRSTAPPWHPGLAVSWGKRRPRWPQPRQLGRVGGDAVEQLRCGNCGPDRCTRCGGCIDLTEDHYGPYYRCLSCGRHTYADPQVGNADCPDGEDIQPGNPGGLHEPGGVLLDVRQEEDGGPCAPWYPCRPDTQERYRRIREIITRADLSVPEAMRRFGLSRRTIQRIRKG